MERVRLVQGTGEGNGQGSASSGTKHYRGVETYREFVKQLGSDSRVRERAMERVLLVQVLSIIVVLKLIENRVRERAMEKVRLVQVLSIILGTGEGIGRVSAETPTVAVRGALLSLIQLGQDLATSVTALPLLASSLCEATGFDADSTNYHGSLSPEKARFTLVGSGILRILCFNVNRKQGVRFESSFNESSISNHDAHFEKHWLRPARLVAAARVNNRPYDGYEVIDYMMSLERARWIASTTRGSTKLQSNGLQVQDEDAANLERQVAIHYNRLHGLLQLQEEELLKKIRNCKDEAQKSLGSVLSNLEENIKEMETILTVGKASLEPSNFSSLPLSPLLDKLTNVTEMPCYLLLNNDQSINNFGFHEDSSIIDLLKGHCTISVPDKRTYELCSKLNLPEDYQFESIPDFPDPFKKPDLSVLTSRKKLGKITTNQLSEPKLPKTEAKNKPTPYQEILRKNRLTLQNNNSEETMSTSSADSAFEKICVAPPLEEGTTEIVRICHLISPNNFYVQRKCTYSQLEKLRDHFSKQMNIRKNQPASIEKYEIYLVQFKVDKKWYRAQVKEVMEDKCEIFYVDYGNTETVDIKKLRDIPERYKTIPDQAIHCSLANCVPVGGMWNEEAVKIFASMSNNVELSMFVVNINRTSKLHEVHLRRVQDLNCSFADSLIFLGCAGQTDVVNLEGLFKDPSSKKGFFKDIDIQKGDTFDGQVTHINTPTNFYLQRIADGGKLLLQQMTDLTLVYSHMGPQENVIYNPTPGMMVAAKFSDGSWYRGVILSIPRSCHIEVQYVDFGNVETVNWKDVRLLLPKFQKMSAQGLKCSLSDIAPKHEKGWTASAKKAFEGLAKAGLLRVYVDDIKDSHFSVTLYDIQRDKDICINGGLVEKGYANSIGPR
ncbi:metal ion binding [Homalodisca vitripennis]|nr:metal ion binding [Homalodisca vitripennis]